MKLICCDADWKYNRNHYLYKFVPLCTIPKIESYIEQNIIPQFTQEIADSLSDFFEKADAMLYPEEKNREFIEQQFNKLTDCLAILAFVPGGFDLFGKHYEVYRECS